MEEVEEAAPGTCTRIGMCLGLASLSGEAGWTLCPRQVLLKGCANFSRGWALSAGSPAPLRVLKRSWKSFLCLDSWRELSKDLSLSLKEVKSEIFPFGTLEASGEVSCKLTFSRSVGTSSILWQGGVMSAGNTLDGWLGKLWVRRARSGGRGYEGWAALAGGEPQVKKAEALLAMSFPGDCWLPSLLELVLRRLKE